jgi:hypothetical protein
VRGLAFNPDTIAEFASLSGMMLEVADGFEPWGKEGQHCGFASAQPIMGAAR